MELPTPRHDIDKQTFRNLLRQNFELMIRNERIGYRMKTLNNINHKLKQRQKTYEDKNKYIENKIEETLKYFGENVYP